MKNVIFPVVMAVSLSASAAFAAGDAANAMEVARAQQACGEGAAIVSARYMEDGRVGVTCRKGAAATGARSGAGGFGSGGTLGALFAVVLVAAAAGGGGSSSSDTVMK
ncbi:MAG: hypothetical protein ACSHXH_16270 [Marivita sp.]|uniref:hypothetical protein n=1 Tax=Marivita sp. TaxID=2003365 RepID=UPI003EF0A746